METKEKQERRSRVMQFILFGTAQCKPCQAIKPIVKEVAQKFNGKFRYIDLSENPMVLKEKFPQLDPIFSVPTLVILKGGDVLYRRSGSITGKKLEEIVRGLS
jgi:thioredoxin 1